MDNTDLDAIEREIAKRKENEVATVEETPVAPVINFDKKPEAVSVEVAEKQPPKDIATELIDSAFNQAIIHEVSTNEEVKNELLDSAQKVIKNKTNAIKERGEQEDKAAYFNNRKGACDCFGYDETTTEKWAVKSMNFWHNIMTAIWIFIGSFTFAPVAFVAKKLVVIFKKTWIAVVIAILLYLFISIGIPLLTGLLNK